MTKTEILKFRRFIWFSPMIGVLIGLFYLMVKSGFDLSIGFTEVRTLSTIVAGFSFTMLGFLAAISAFLFSLQKYKFFKRWVQDGNSEVFFTLFKITFICLFVTFSLSLFVFTSKGQNLAFKVMMMSVVNNVIQLCAITTILMDKVFKARESD